MIHCPFTRRHYLITRVVCVLVVITLSLLPPVHSRLTGKQQSDENEDAMQELLNHESQNEDRMLRPFFNIGGSKKFIDGTYIVAFDQNTIMPDAVRRIQSILDLVGGSRDATLEHVLPGVVLSNVPSSAVEYLSTLDFVHSIEPDMKVQLDTLATQTNPPNWGLDRINQKFLPLDKLYTYPQNAGTAGAVAFILDSGIRLSHQEFVSSQVFCIYNGYTTTEQCLSDGYGHGTEVASIIAGRTYGVAKGVTIGIAKIFDSTGTGGWSKIIAALDALVAYKQANPNTPCVANLSFSGPFYQTGNNAVAATIAAGIIVSSAAGNGYKADACVLSPGSTPGIMVIGATSKSDVISSYSNDGTCISVYAPADNVRCATITTDSSSALKSGTSISTPHVTGIALFYAIQYPQATVADIKTMIETDAAPVVTGAIGNRLVNLSILNALNV